MGRIFETRKRTMFARWARTSKAFTKIGKEIAIAIKLGGADPHGNPRLRMAIQTARSHNMPKDRIENAIYRASHKDTEDLEEIAYEAYAPHGVALFVEAATNNPTRTIANVRNFITKHGGTMATEGALSFVFERRGFFKIAPPKGDVEEFELEMIDHGLIEMYAEEEGDYLIEVQFPSFGNAQKFLEEKGVEVRSAGLHRIALSTVELSETDAAPALKIIELLEEDDDVQNVYHNMRTVDSE